MSTNEPTSEQEDYQWYYIDKTDNSTKGPISLRELDVFIRTNILDSHSYVWREGFLDWKKIYQTEDLKDLVTDTSTEVMESIMRNKIQSSLSQKLESSTTQQNFYLGGDGYWHVFNPVSKTWHKQETVLNFIMKKPVPARKKSIDESTKPGESENTNTNNNTEGTEKINEETNPDNEKSENPSPNLDTEHKPDEELRKKRKMGQNLDKILTDEQIKEYERLRKKREKLKEKKKKKWYDARINSSIYVSGLPVDITEEECVVFFSKCGLIRKDPVKHSYKLKIYKDNNGKNKGDALISYLREESVSICIDLLNDTEIRPGFKIKIEPAKFEQKGEYKERNAVKLDEIERKKLESEKERLLGWEEEDQAKGLKIIVLKNLFSPEEFIEDPSFRNDLELDMIEECENSFGEIEKIQIFEENPQGILKIKFKTAVAAEKAIQAINGRFYNGRTIQCFYWDGKTDYKKANEDIETQNRRIEEFGKWLEEEGEEEIKNMENDVINSESKETESKEIDVTEEVQKIEN